MLPGMVQQAMNQPAPPPPPLPSAAGRAASAPAAGGLDFGDLARASNDPRAMVRAVVQSAGYTLQETSDRWQVTVPIDGLRKQRVTVEFGQADDKGHAMLTLWSVCGPAGEQNAMALLRYNTKLLHGAFAVRKLESGEALVLQANLMIDTLAPLEITRTLSAIAWQADKAEQQLVGGDQH
jgi:hypothetical protein